MNINMNEVAQFVSTKVLVVHRRNGGAMRQLDLSLPLKDATLLLDSLDLAEIVAEIEREYRVNLFEGTTGITCWNHIVDAIVTSQRKDSEHLS